jgi:hypothetical protein
VGSHQCAVLVQFYSKVPLTASWKAGSVVKGDRLLTKGTAIATFVNGKYQNKSHGNHACYFVSWDPTGFYVMEQWLGLKTIQKRLLISKGKKKDGSFIDPSNNADAFSVIET